MYRESNRKRERQEEAVHQIEERQRGLEQHQVVTDERIETEQRSATRARAAIGREQRSQQIQLEYMILPPQQKVRLASDIIKIGAKAGVYVGSKAVKKIASKVATIATGQLVKQAPKIAMFGIPLVGVLFGLVAGIYRFSQGEWVLGAGEVLSGAVSCLSLVPGVGTGMAMGAVVLIDAAITACDAFELIPSRGDRPAIYANVGGSYQVLGLDPNQNPTRGQVDEAHRTQMNLFHMDHTEGEIGANFRGRPDEYVRVIDEARNLIYRHNHWE